MVPYTRNAAWSPGFIDLVTWTDEGWARGIAASSGYRLKRSPWTRCVSGLLCLVCRGGVSATAEGLKIHEPPGFGGKSSFQISSSPADSTAPVANRTTELVWFGFNLQLKGQYQRRVFLTWIISGIWYSGTQKNPSAISGAEGGMVICRWHVRVSVTSRCDPAVRLSPQGPCLDHWSHSGTR